MLNSTVFRFWQGQIQGDSGGQRPGLGWLRFGIFHYPVWAVGSWCNGQSAQGTWQIWVNPTQVSDHQSPCIGKLIFHYLRSRSPFNLNWKPPVIVIILLPRNVVEIFLNQVFISISSVFSHSLIILPQKESRSIASPLFKQNWKNLFYIILSMWYPLSYL